MNGTDLVLTLTKDTVQWLGTDVILETRISSVWKAVQGQGQEVASKLTETRLDRSNQNWFSIDFWKLFFGNLKIELAVSGGRLYQRRMSRSQRRICYLQHRNMLKTFKNLFKTSKSNLKFKKIFVKSRNSVLKIYNSD